GVFGGGVVYPWRTEHLVISQVSLGRYAANGGQRPGVLHARCRHGSSRPVALTVARRWIGIGGSEQTCIAARHNHFVIGVLLLGAHLDAAPFHFGSIGAPALSPHSQGGRRAGKLYDVPIGDNLSPARG